MKQKLHYFSVLFLTVFLFGINAQSQELIYEQDHGLTFNKGTINTDVLLRVIQQKQDELNKFVLSRLITDSWNDSDKSEDTNSRLDNFTTKYLIYETLSELTVTADKSKFGKNTLELLKEAATIFGLAVAINEGFNGDFSDLEQRLHIQRFNKNQQAIDLDKAADRIQFNQTLDMVLNVCITNPAISKYFPIYGQLANQEDVNRTWYENDSRYYPYRSDSSVAAIYLSVKNDVEQLYNWSTELKKDWEVLHSVNRDSLLNTVSGKLLKYIVSDTIILGQLNHGLVKVSKIQDADPEFKIAVDRVLAGKNVFDSEFVKLVREFRYEYDAVKGRIRRNDQYDSAKVHAFINALKEETAETDRKLRKECREFEDLLNKQTQSGGTVPKSTISSWLQTTAKQDSSWAKILLGRRFAGYNSDAMSTVERTLTVLEQLADRATMIRSLFGTLITSGKPGPMNSFAFNEQQLESVKELMNRLIDYLDKSGKYSTASIYLRSIISNISYSEADSLTRKPATVSLNFESVLFSLNDHLVTPARLERTRYVEAYLNIGVNYSGFLYSNQLQQNADGTSGALTGMTFASEKIGIKYKIINRQYTRSFKPGVVYRYYGKDWSWKRPQPQGLLDDVFLDIHTGGLLYNVVNLTTEENFSFPFVGGGLGVRSFNGLTFSGSLNAPFTGHTFRKENLFVMFSVDVPIIDYIRALRN